MRVRNGWISEIVKGKFIKYHEYIEESIWELHSTQVTISEILSMSEII